MPESTLVPYYDIRRDEFVNVPAALKENAEKLLNEWWDTTDVPRDASPLPDNFRDLGDRGMWAEAYVAAQTLRRWIDNA